MRVMALFSTSFFAKILRVGEDGPGRGHPCHTDIFLVSSVSSLSFLFLFLLCPSLSSLLLSFFSLSLGDDTKRPTRVDVSLNPNTINQKTRGRGLFSL